MTSSISSPTYTNTLINLISVLEQKLRAPYHEDDTISACGNAPLAILQTRPDDVIKLAHEKLHVFPFKDVSSCWRRLYTEAALWKALKILKSVESSLENGDAAKTRICEGIGDQEDWVSAVIKTLDMGIILTGAPLREDVIACIMKELGKILEETFKTEASIFCLPSSIKDTSLKERPLKRQKLVKDPNPTIHDNPTAFSWTNSQHPKLRYPISRISAPSMSSFSTHINTQRMPLIITYALNHWPALSNHPWSNPRYLLSQTLHGRRLVPIELGRTYTDEDWGQRITSFGSFLTEHMLAPTDANGERLKGYLAQHDLLSQVPALRADVSIPDYCYVDPPEAEEGVPSAPPLEEPLLNAWFGPAGTISPLHTDPYHNILTQVVGHKYIRLYAPSQTSNLYPRGIGDDGVDMGNTSLVDISEGIALFEKDGSDADTDGHSSEDLGARRQEFLESFPRFNETKYVEGILGPGECLYVPQGWWHYVQSLDVSISVSFWWN